MIGRLLLALLMFVAYGLSQQSGPSTTSHSRASVRDSARAIKIARSAAEILDPKPTAQLENGLWTVSSRACCHDKNRHLTCEPGRCWGGGARVVIRETDGKVLSTTVFK